MNKRFLTIIEVLIIYLVATIWDWQAAMTMVGFGMIVVLDFAMFSEED